VGLATASAGINHLHDTIFSTPPGIEPWSLTYKASAVIEFFQPTSSKICGTLLVLFPSVSSPNADVSVEEAKFGLTIRLDSELNEVLADPRERRTVKAAAKCLKASVSGPPPATSNNCRRSSMEAYVLPEPLIPAEVKRMSLGTGISL
jgi:hypothetical protein